MGVVCGNHSYDVHVEVKEGKRLYVSIDVGGEKKKTKPYKEIHHSPQWNEEFRL